MQQKVWTQVAPWLFPQLSNIFKNLAISNFLPCHSQHVDFYLPSSHLMAAMWLPKLIYTHAASKGRRERRGKNTFSSLASFLSWPKSFWKLPDDVFFHLIGSLGSQAYPQTNYHKPITGKGEWGYYDWFKPIIVHSLQLNTLLPKQNRGSIRKDAIAIGKVANSVCYTKIVSVGTGIAAHVNLILNPDILLYTLAKIIPSAFFHKCNY